MNLRLPDGSRLAATIPPIVHPTAVDDYTPLYLARLHNGRSDRAKDADCESGKYAHRRGWTRRQHPYFRWNLNGQNNHAQRARRRHTEQERILIIEDTAELHIRKPHVVQQEAQTDTHRHPVTFDDLLKAALRHRPDRIILGEIRGTEARTLLDSMNTGHRGALATIHASSAQGALLRLRTLLMRGASLAAARGSRCGDLFLHPSGRAYRPC